MKRSQLALSKAVESGDTDLVYTVVTYLKNEMNRGDFFMTLRNQPVALSLYRQVLLITSCCSSSPPAAPHHLLLLLLFLFLLITFC
ncbi:vacuolar protein sorting-associated protein 16 homolog [Plectropomus leopardus]|uniref:vacuolar protein sorting-associated protein 16 homolog n=1 Tax=Plectropomus leopardus TaxID=160734 RepID=UPI001C4AD7D9|nr:vacuolar protein sorting-associated protein 16 homolog [Plectropomus leopardus]